MRFPFQATLANDMPNDSLGGRIFGSDQLHDPASFLLRESIGHRLRLDLNCETQIYLTGGYDLIVGRDELINYGWHAMSLARGAKRCRAKYLTAGTATASPIALYPSL